MNGSDLVVTGFGRAGPPCDSTRYLKARKQRKFMGLQDELAVVAAGRALESAGLPGPLGERAGLFLAVGYIPFEQSDIDLLMAGSLQGGRFSMERFSTDGYAGVNPLITFRCLSNMPAYHISVNFDLQGPYFVTYPGPGQFYLALEEAAEAIGAGKVDVALVGGVAHQDNFLVRHHFRRLEPPADRLSDSAGLLVLEAPGHAGPRARGRLLGWTLDYRAVDPFEEGRSPEETGADGSMGPASLPVALAERPPGRFRHQLRSRDGFVASSDWEVA
jgi:3-oxoacyl-(acyl-carrier-protein) synthase